MWKFELECALQPAKPHPTPSVILMEEKAKRFPKELPKVQ
jgi:hypothetical protein